jgi:hypothetical protein
MLYIGLDEKDLAFEWIAKGCETRDTLMCYLAVGPTFDPLRSDARFNDMLQKIALADLADNAAASTISLPVFRQASAE